MLRVDGVGRRFGSGTLALEDVSLSVGPGDFVALLGPSGCGKSTLLRLIAGLDAPDTGAVVWNGTAPRVGFVFQDPTLLPWASALDNVRLPFRLRGQDGEVEARAALSRVGLAGFEAARPRQLSGGMRMRVSLARALVTSPRLLLLDEPFAALDEFTRHALQADLRNLWQTNGGSIVFVTHSIYEAAYLARRIVVMSARPGRIVADIASALPEHDDPDDRRLSPAYAALVADITHALRRAHAS
ncbi:MAG: ABC transporter ATP-binding protein [Pseudomonadota bacterium]|nr:ABC transporter ATP-binding protein [Pseudomonadota bacterium]